MNKKFKLTVCFVAALSLLPIAFFLSSYLYRLDKISYNFKRNLKKYVSGYHSIDIKYNTFYIAGNSDGNIFLGNRKAALYVLKSDTLLKDTSSSIIRIDNKYFNNKGFYKLSINNSHFSLANGFARSVLQGNVHDWKADSSKIFKPFFSQSVSISSNSMAFRMVSHETRENVLRKESILSGPITNEKVLEKQIDGRFCTSGILQYNTFTKQIIYLYFYRNQILLLDTNLNLRGKIKTIDPIDTANFKVAYEPKQHATTFSSPPLLVNANYSVWKNLIFVQSRLMGKNEDELRFNRSSVMDVYDLTTQKYKYSFYVPKFRNLPMKDFKVIENNLFALAGNYLVRYTLILPKS